MSFQTFKISEKNLTITLWYIISDWYFHQLNINWANLRYIFYFSYYIQNIILKLNAWTTDADLYIQNTVLWGLKTKDKTIANKMANKVRQAKKIMSIHGKNTIVHSLQHFRSNVVWCSAESISSVSWHQIFLSSDEELWTKAILQTNTISRGTYWNEHSSRLNGSDLRKHSQTWCSVR